MNQLRKLIEESRFAGGPHVFTSPDGSVRGLHPGPAGAVTRLSLRELTLPQFLAGNPLHKVHCPMGEQAGKRTTLDTAILNASRVAKAGARLVMVSHAPDPIDTGASGVPAFKRREARFDVIEAAAFAKVPDGEDVATSTLPVYRAEIDLETIPSYGFRLELSRADQKKYDDGGILSDCALVSLALGVARVADAALLQAIQASDPATTASPAAVLSMAAAAGLKFAELAALVGTAGTGAAVGQDGALRAAGVPAELTGDTADTYVGAFNRAAVAVVDEITLTAERTNKNGGLVLTCFANVQPLMPRPGVFRKLVAA